MYSLSPENRRSVAIIEIINATGQRPLPPVITIQGKQLQAKWYKKELPKGTLIINSEKGFTNDEIAVTFLQHYIKNTDDCGANKPWKLLLCDNHKSHETPAAYIYSPSKQEPYTPVSSPSSSYSLYATSSCWCPPSL